MTNAIYNRLDKDNAVVLLVDHQAGLLSLVRDIEPDKFKNNVLALGAVAKFFNLPTILTTSFETGPNGPLVPELREMFPDAPYIARPGNINAWDNEDFVKAVKGPLPWVKIMPTGGVDPDEASIAKWFGAGIVAAGMGSKLVTDAAVKAGDWAGIEAQVKKTVEAVAAFRAKG